MTRIRLVVPALVTSTVSPSTILDTIHIVSAGSAVVAGPPVPVTGGGTSVAVVADARADVGAAAAGAGAAGAGAADVDVVAAEAATVDVVLLLPEAAPIPMPVRTTEAPRTAIRMALPEGRWPVGAESLGG